jgi:hypothetical protein
MTHPPTTRPTRAHARKAECPALAARHLENVMLANLHERKSSAWMNPQDEDAKDATAAAVCQTENLSQRAWSAFETRRKGAAIF